MGHVSLRLRAVISVAVAALCCALAAGTAGANGGGAAMLFADVALGFSGAFTNPAPVLTPGNELSGCPSEGTNVGGVVNCRYFTFTAGATGDATLTIDVEDGVNFVDAATHCNGEPAARALASSNAGEPGTATFPVVQADVCEVRVSIFLADLDEATPTNPLFFVGSVTLGTTIPGGGVVGGTPSDQDFDIKGGGKVAQGTFSVKVETEDVRDDDRDHHKRGNVRWFSPTGCKTWSEEITSVTVSPAPDGWIATITGYAKLRQNGVTTEHVPFEARAEDHGRDGDRFHHNLCGGVDAPVDHGKIEIEPEDDHHHDDD
jgi:hypothetical protein